MTPLLVGVAGAALRVAPLEKPNPSGSPSQAPSQVPSPAPSTTPGAAITATPDAAPFGRKSLYLEHPEPTPPAQRALVPNLVHHTPMPSLSGIRRTDNHRAGYLRWSLAFSLSGAAAGSGAALAATRFFTVLPDPDPRVRPAVADGPYRLRVETGRALTTLSRRPVPKSSGPVRDVVVWSVEGLCVVEFGLDSPLRFRVTESDDELLVDFAV